MGLLRLAVSIVTFDKTVTRALLAAFSLISTGDTRTGAILAALTLTVNPSTRVCKESLWRSGGLPLSTVSVGGRCKGDGLGTAQGWECSLAAI